MEVRESSNVDEPRNMVAEQCQLKVKICHCPILISYLNVVPPVLVS